MRKNMLISIACSAILTGLSTAAGSAPSSPTQAHTKSLDAPATAYAEEYGDVKVSFYMDNDGFYHLYFYNGRARQVYVTATYNGKAYNCRLAANSGSQDFTLGKASPDPALLQASYMDE